MAVPDFFTTMQLYREWSKRGASEQEIQNAIALQQGSDSAGGSTGSGSSSSSSGVSGTFSLAPLGNGVVISAAAESSTPSSLIYETGALYARIQITEGQIRFSNGEAPDSADLIFTASTGDLIALESPEQIQNFRFTALGAGAAALAVQQYSSS